ncbi:HNH endonuclease [Bradyrhizobium stylosanthis]|uniref:HNH endonuclease n=1 Tax=Bradyrhizobium stylosanthis TaxID=1803665 RepID=A0A560CXF2_9BRAD|nr:HNH endonuclease [Bradyrhizobium stylosanthis]TWA89542.1 HNH endonuclease [Bradyrhizobium stylosanthis]
MPSFDEANDLLRYEPATGLFFWRETRGGVRAGAVAGSFRRGYIRIRLNGVLYGAHRLAWLLTHNCWVYIDHINGDPQDNRIENLRPATHLLNMANVKRHRDNASGFKGVAFDPRRGKFQAQICVGGRKKHLGRYHRRRGSRRLRGGRAKSLRRVREGCMKVIQTGAGPLILRGAELRRYNIERVRGYLEKNLGCTDKEVAFDLDLSRHTVRKAIGAIRAERNRPTRRR